MLERGMNFFYAIPYSPWSEKARWAMDAHGVPYQEKVYVPMIDTPWLRLKSKRYLERLTVPLLITPTGSYMDSFDIARWSVSAHPEANLIPEHTREQIEEWNIRSERMLAAGRALTTHKVAKHRPAWAESVPGPLQRLGPVAELIARVGMRYLDRKYQLGAYTPDISRRVLRENCLALRAGLETHGETLCAAFSYADIAMAVALQFIAPIETDIIRLGTESIGCWSEPELAHEFADLVAWRDALYTTKRGIRPT
jgi:glutathione S-transferase